jgi:hypothetical protein
MYLVRADVLVGRIRHANQQPDVDVRPTDSKVLEIRVKVKYDPILNGSERK